MRRRRTTPDEVISRRRTQLGIKAELGPLEQQTPSFRIMKKNRYESAERTMSVKISYHKLDYESGKAIQILRGRIGLTQAGLAEYLGISTRTVNGWEAGGRYPKTEHLKNLIALAVERQAWAPGSEASAIRVLWIVTHQKM